MLHGLVSNPDSYAEAMLRLAAIDVGLGMRAPAKDKLHELLQKHPKNMAARLFNSRLLVLDGKRDEAFAMAGSIVKDEPNSCGS